MRKMNMVAVLLLAWATTVVGADKKELPFYFPEGLVQTNDAFRQLQEIRRLWASESHRLHSVEWSVVGGKDSITVETDIMSTSSVTNAKHGTKMKLIFDHYTRLDDGRIRVMMPRDGYRIITQQQFDVVKNDLIELTTQAAQMKYDYWAPITDPVAEGAVAARADKLGIPLKEFAEMLDKPVHDYPNITYRELHGLPAKSRVSDFVPKEFHFGYTWYNGVYALVYLNTGVMYYTPMARVVDHLWQKPFILGHEFTHANANIQRYPGANAFDAELMADVPGVFDSTNKHNLLHHHYDSELRELIWVYFGFNFNQVYDEAFKFNAAGNLMVDEEKYREYAEKLEEVKKTLPAFFQKVWSEFFSSTLWHMAMNEKMMDDNTVLKLMFAAHFNPTILDGSKNTMQWLDAHAAKIREISNRAWKKSGTMNNTFMGMQEHVPAFMVAQYKQLPAQERERIEAYFRKHPEQLKRLVACTTIDQAMGLFKEFEPHIYQGGRR